MKEASTTIFKSLARVIGVMALVACATTDTYAETITKTFEFGAGTALTHSHVRTFNIPCGLSVSATVKFQRHGPASADSDIPIKIDLREPDTSAGQEGLIVKTESAFAKTTQQTLTLNGAATNRGCSLPWRVRVRYANEGTAPFTIYGSIKLDFDTSVRTISVPVHTERLFHGSSTTKNLGSSSGLKQGIIEITAKWIHFVPGLHPIPGPFPSTLQFQLIDPDGRAVKIVEGYSSHENKTPKLKLVYRVADCVPGQWKLKITNYDFEKDVIDIATKATFTPDCP